MVLIPSPKLKSFGISGYLLKWFDSYLIGRKQRVVINGAFPPWADVMLDLVYHRVLYLDRSSFSVCE